MSRSRALFCQHAAQRVRTRFHLLLMRWHESGPSIGPLDKGVGQSSLPVVLLGWVHAAAHWQPCSPGASQGRAHRVSCRLRRAARSRRCFLMAGDPIAAGAAGCAAAPRARCCSAAAGDQIAARAIVYAAASLLEWSSEAAGDPSTAGVARHKLWPHSAWDCFLPIADALAARASNNVATTGSLLRSHRVSKGRVHKFLLLVPAA